MLSIRLAGPSREMCLSIHSFIHSDCQVFYFQREIIIITAVIPEFAKGLRIFQHVASGMKFPATPKASERMDYRTYRPLWSMCALRSCVSEPRSGGGGLQPQVCPGTCIV